MSTFIDDIVGYLTEDKATKTWRTFDPHKTIETGQLFYHYRSTGKFILRESVLKGFHKDFLDGLDLFTSSGCHLGKMYRIRNNQYNQLASKELVEKMLKEYLYSKSNIDRHLEYQLSSLYSDKSLCTESLIESISVFIRVHEKGHNR